MKDADINKIIQHTGWHQIVVSDGNGDATIHTSDPCSNQEGILFEIGDCEHENFPLMKKLEDYYNSEVYTIDGGHDDIYQEYLGKKED